MFDVVGAFKKQFTRVEGGYIVYPSRRVGGKLVNEEEYACLVEGWRRASGRAGRWKAIGAIVVVLIVWTLLSDWLSAPEWADSVVIALLVVAMSGWLFWASTAPRRLVRGRAPVTPPRSAAEARREGRATLNWRFVIFALLISGAVFIGSVTANERTLGTWAWLTGSGVLLGAYCWIAFTKLMDRKR